MSFDEQTSAAFDAAGDTTKQLLALATGTIGGAIALFDNGDKAGIEFGDNSIWIRAGLGLLALSVLSGLMTLGAIVGQLGGKDTTPNVYAPAIKLFYTLQLICYGFGVAAFVIEVIF